MSVTNLQIQFQGENPQALPSNERAKVADIYAARDSTMPPLRWPSIAPPFTAADHTDIRTCFDKFRKCSRAYGAIDLLKQALSEDPDCAEAHALLSLCLLRVKRLHGARAEAGMALDRALLERALLEVSRESGTSAP